ncbi:MAG TPA: hypothetical protein VKV32_01965 [Stellaceae bacterium]|nr:hypothetical protein [Stellaceae bacterium]
MLEKKRDGVDYALGMSKGHQESLAEAIRLPEKPGMMKYLTAQICRSIRIDGDSELHDWVAI